MIFALNKCIDSYCAKALNRKKRRINDSKSRYNVQATKDEMSQSEVIEEAVNALYTQSRPKQTVKLHSDGVNDVHQQRHPSTQEGVDDLTEQQCYGFRCAII